jgi:hypothetical protein
MLSLPIFLIEKSNKQFIEEEREREERREKREKRKEKKNKTA